MLEHAVHQLAENPLFLRLMLLQVAENPPFLYYNLLTFWIKFMPSTI